MQSEQFLRLFQIKEVELPSFMRLLGHSFFNALGIALSFSAINIYLINQHGIGILPVIFLLSAVLLLISGRLYALFESRLAPAKLFTYVLVLCIAWALGARAISNFSSSLELIVLLYALYLVVYQLSNLEFWGVTSLLYDVRQSKRLFGLLTTGESLGKILGYLFTPLIVLLFSVPDLFVFAAISFGLSLLFLYALTKGNADKLEVHHDHHHHKSDEATSVPSLRIFGFISDKLKDPFIRLSGLFAMLSIFVFYFIQYSFLERVEVHFGDVEQLAIFFGFFFSFGKLVNLLKKTFLFSRLFWRLKISHMILILPGILGIITLVGLTGTAIIDDNLIFLLWIFGLLMLMDEIVRSSIHLPAFFILFQPMNKHKRLEAHTLAKGYMEPIGLGLTGLVLIGMNAAGMFELRFLIFCLALGIALWLTTGYFLGRKYSELIHFLLKNRLLSSTSLEFSKEELEILEKQVETSGDSVSLLYKLKLAGNDLPFNDRFRMITSLLQDDNSLVVAEAINLMGKIPDERYLPYLRVLIDHEDIEVSGEAVFKYCSVVQAESVSELEDSVKFSRGLKREYLIAGVLKYAGIYGATTYGESLLAWISSKNPNERQSAARIIGLVAKKEFYHPLIQLLDDPNRNVKEEAIMAAGKVGNRHLLPLLIKIAVSGQLFRPAVKAIENFGNDAVPYLKFELEKAHSHNVLNRLLKVAGGLSGSESTSLLRQYLNQNGFELRATAITALFRKGFIESEPEKINELQELISFEYDSFKHLSTCLGKKSISHDLRHAIVSEIKSLQTRVLKIIGLIYGRKLIQKVEDSLLTGDQNMSVNAIELLENNTSSKLSSLVSPILEFTIVTAGDWNHSGWEMGKTDILSRLLNKNKIPVSHWLLGMLIREYRLSDYSISEDCVDKLKNIDSDIISQELSTYTFAYGISD